MYPESNMMKNVEVKAEKNIELTEAINKTIDRLCIKIESVSVTVHSDNRIREQAEEMSPSNHRLYEIKSRLEALLDSVRL